MSIHGEVAAYQLFLEKEFRILAKVDPVLFGPLCHHFFYSFGIYINNLW